MRLPSAKTTLVLILTLLPFFLGMFGTGSWFIPNPTFRSLAVLAGIAYYAVLWFLVPRIKGPRAAGPPGEKIKLALALPVACYFAYVAFYITIPAALTQILGAPAHREYVVAAIDQASKRAWLCPYRVKLQGVRTVLTDSLCVDEAFAQSISSGAVVSLRGNESVFGFRFVSHAS